MEIAYRFGFDAAHRFEGFPEGHLYHGVHGHSFQVEVAIEGEPDATTGFVADLGELEHACRGLRERLDHRMLNDVAGLEKPSLENLCLWIWAALEKRFALAHVTVRRDSYGQSATYRGKK